MAKKKIKKQTLAEKKAIVTLRKQASKLGKKLVNSKTKSKGSPIKYSKKSSSSGGLYCYKLKSKKK